MMMINTVLDIHQPPPNLITNQHPYRMMVDAIEQSMLHAIVGCMARSGMQLSNGWPVFAGLWMERKPRHRAWTHYQGINARFEASIIGKQSSC
jgi:hypothetical protein